MNEWDDEGHLTRTRIPSNADLGLVSSAQVNYAHPPPEEMTAKETGNGTVVGVPFREEVAVEYDCRHLALVSSYLGVAVGVVVKGVKMNNVSG